MLPTLWPGDIVDVQSVALSDLRRGELAVFILGPWICTHRVVRSEGASLVTRGDTLASEDLPVSPDDLLGRVVSIHRRRVRMAPRATVGRMQTFFASLICRSGLFRVLVLRLHALRLRLIRSPLQEMSWQ